MTSSSPPSSPAASRFAATLSPKMKLITYLVGYGVLLGVPLVVGSSIAIETGKPLWYTLWFPFALVMIPVQLYRPRGYRIDSKGIVIERWIGDRTHPWNTIARVGSGDALRASRSIGLFRVGGLYGTFGIFYNQTWGIFQVWMTDERSLVEIVFRDQRREFISPAPSKEFLHAYSRWMIEHGPRIR